MKKIALLVYDVSLTGGAERVAIGMCEELCASYEVHLLSLFDERSFAPTGDYRFSYMQKNAASITAHLFSYARWLRRYIKENGIDVVFSITAGVVGVAAYGVRRTNARLIYCEHSNLENQTYGKKHFYRQKLGAKKADVTVTLTERDRENFKRTFGVPDEKLRVIPNWFTKNESVKASYDAASKLLISAGRLESVKGQDMLLRAAAGVCAAHPDWHLDIYGDGSRRGALEAQARELGIADFVTFKGNVSDLALRYPKYAIFILPSYYEGLPLVLLEAQAAGLPIVSFDCPTGPAEIVTDGVNGYLIPTYDTDAMANRINELIEDNGKRVAFSEKSGISIDKFSRERVFALWRELIEEVR